ncbi:hypothetical protein SUDANB176_00204 [Streptomyces sp. enrichment culture]
MAEPVRVRGLTDQEGQKLQQIVRRGSTSSVRYRRAMMLPASAGGNRVPVIAQLVQADEDTVRDVIPRFKERARIRSEKGNRSPGYARRSSVTWMYRRQASAPGRVFRLVEARGGIRRPGMRQTRAASGPSRHLIQPWSPTHIDSLISTAPAHRRTGGNEALQVKTTSQMPSHLAGLR